MRTFIRLVGKDQQVPRQRMHPDEVETDVPLVRRLLATQFPAWAELPIGLVDSFGTDHDIYRIGDGLAARLPRIGWAAGQAAMEAAWLPRFAPQLPLAVPVQLARGRPACGYPFEWSVCEWLPGENANGTIDADDASWLRGRGWALFQAVVALPYYWHTNPGMVRQASHALTEVLADSTP